ncbi:MAG: P-II family nitrogen regulator [Zhaonellaceae bacterium]|jgi:nitrogen regulatory protein PII|nr:P-II family nitrogen regulator [Clostridia bacterium]
MLTNGSKQTEIELICVIVNFGTGSKVLRIAKKNGISGGTVFLGRGTVNNRILKWLDLDDIRKEIVLMLAEKSEAYNALEAIASELALHKPNHGIAFTVSVKNLIGSCRYQNVKEERGGENPMHDAIFVVVDRGKAEDVVEAATKAGSKGATIIHGRGSGIHETSKLFAMEIEPEKELVLILAEENLTEAITESVRKEMKIDMPGKGIMFVIEVNKTYGLIR